MPQQVDFQQRYTRQRPCPICGGCEHAQRGQGVRCWGYLSGDGRFAHCTRSENAGDLQVNPNSQTYPHRLFGGCGCGQRHGGMGSGLNPPKEVATYDYRCPSGELSYQVVRYEPKTFKVRRPNGKGGWVWNRKGVRLILYRLPEVLAAPPDAVVFINEGEKDADRVADLDLASTTSPFGAGKFHLVEDLNPLRGRWVVILQHNDSDGKAHVDDVGAALQGIAGKIHVLLLPGLPDHGDVSDWLDSENTRADLLELAQGAPEWEPPPSSATFVHDVPAFLEEFRSDNDHFVEAPPLTWALPVHFADVTGPAFPLDVFPVHIQDVVAAEAEAFQVPIDLPAVLTLGTASAAGAGRCVVRLSPDWAEPLNTFSVVALASGERKSPVYRDLVAPLEEREHELAMAAELEIASAQTEANILQRRLQESKNSAARAKSPEERELLTLTASELAQDLAALSIPTVPRLLADDATSEAVASLLAAQGGRIAIMSTEGGLFETLAGRYAAGVLNIDVYLKGFSGDPLRVDRKGRPPEFIRKPALTLCLTVQPDVVRDLTSKRGFRGRGLLARFLYSIPQSMVGYRSSEALPVPNEYRQRWSRAIKDISKLPVPHEGHEHAIQLSFEANTIFQRYRDWVEIRLRPGGELSDIADWGNKLCGAVARIAGILHLLSYHDQGSPWEVPIQSQTITAAIRLGNYFAGHADVAFTMMGVDPGVEKAKVLWASIQRRGVNEFSQRDLAQRVRRRFSVYELTSSLMVLAEMGYLRQLPVVGPSGPGRPPSPTFEVNPLAAAQGSAVPQPDSFNFEDYGDFGYGISGEGSTAEEDVGEV